MEKPVHASGPRRPRMRWYVIGGVVAFLGLLLTFDLGDGPRGTGGMPASGAGTSGLDEADSVGLRGRGIPPSVPRADRPAADEAMQAGGSVTYTGGGDVPSSFVMHAIPLGADGRSSGVPVEVLGVDGRFNVRLPHRSHRLDYVSVEGEAVDYAPAVRHVEESSSFELEVPRGTPARLVFIDRGTGDRVRNVEVFRCSERDRYAAFDSAYHLPGHETLLAKPLWARDGELSLPLASGVRMWAAVAPGFRWRIVRVPYGAALEHTVELSRGGEARLRLVGTAPAGASLCLGESGQSWSDPIEAVATDGHIALRGLDAGSYRLTVRSKVGHVLAESRLVVLVGKLALATLDLRRQVVEEVPVHGDLGPRT